MSKRVVDEVEETTGMIAKQKEKMSQMEDKMAKEKKLIMDLEKKLQEFQGAVETAQSKKESLANMLKVRTCHPSQISPPPELIWNVWNRLKRSEWPG